MFRKGPLIPILILIVAALACRLLPDLPENPDPPKNTQPDVVRKDGECSDQRFKDAELAAYRALVQAQTDAAKALEDEITRIEEVYKQKLSDLDKEYQSALNTCKDAECRLRAEKKYNTGVASQQIYESDGIYVAQWKEQEAVKAAQKAYNEAVEEARKRFCTQAYEAYASGLASQFTQKDICSLEKPFALSGSVPGMSSDFKASFTPESSTQGKVTFTNNLGGCVQSFSGAYVVVFYDHGDGDIQMQGELRMACEGASFVDQTKFNVAIRESSDMVCPDN